MLKDLVKVNCEWHQWKSCMKFSWGFTDPHKLSQTFPSIFQGGHSRWTLQNLRENFHSKTSSNMAYAQLLMCTDSAASPKVRGRGAAPLNRCCFAAETWSRTSTCIFLLTCSRACSVGGAGSSLRAPVLSSSALFPWEEMLTFPVSCALQWMTSLRNIHNKSASHHFHCQSALLTLALIPSREQEGKLQCEVQLWQNQQKEFKGRWKQVPRVCDPSSQQFLLLGFTMLDASSHHLKFTIPLSEWEEQARNLPYCSQSSKPSLLTHITIHFILH